MRRIGPSLIVTAIIGGTVIAAAMSWSSGPAGIHLVPLVPAGCCASVAAHVASRWQAPLKVKGATW